MHNKPEMTAYVAHEVIRAFCKSIGEIPQPPWDELSQELKLSTLSGVMFRLGHPDASSADQHIQWAKDKEEAGWVYGPVKDPEKKQHPCLVPYEELPQEQRSKDYLFAAVVNATHKVLSDCMTKDEHDIILGRL